jgi:molybdopterin converting factor small subunit
VNYLKNRELIPPKREQGGKNERVKIYIMEVKVLFFGVLAEVSGTSIKHYRDVKSTGDLKLRIQDDFPEIVHYNFRVSVNNEITDNNLLLKSGDEVALMPPFAGG